MYVVLIVITIIVCILLGLIVLIQNPKGGGLSSNFSGSSQLMGVQKTGDFLEKGTWVLAIAIMVFSLIINVSVKGGAQGGDDSAQKEMIRKISRPSASASAPAATAPLLPAARPDTTKK